jgi:hypothetical protein
MLQIHLTVIVIVIYVASTQLEGNEKGGVDHLSISTFTFASLHRTRPQVKIKIHKLLYTYILSIATAGFFSFSSYCQSSNNDMVRPGSGFRISNQLVVPCHIMNKFKVSEVPQWVSGSFCGHFTSQEYLHIHTT